jgi:cytochrome b561
MFRNSNSSYGSVARFLHWLMALWILTAYLVITWLTWDHVEGPIAGLNYHKVVGFTILLPLAFRVLWRIMNPPPPLPANMPRWQQRASHLSHFLLYFLLLAMPVSGYFGNFGGVDYGFFKVPPFWQTGMANWIFETFSISPQAWDRFFDSFHYRVVGPYIFPVVILAHVAASLYHHVVQKDDVLLRMLKGTSAD